MSAVIGLVSGAMANAVGSAVTSGLPPLVALRADAGNPSRAAEVRIRIEARIRTGRFMGSLRISGASYPRKLNTETIYLLTISNHSEPLHPDDPS
jgi:hypothetical protein